MKVMEEIGFMYFLACRTDQQCSEFFSSLRGLGGPNVHPDRQQALIRFNIRMLSSDPAIVYPMSKPNVEPEQLQEPFDAEGLSDRHEEILVSS